MTKAIDKEFYKFIEFPTAKKDHVTTTSAIFFAEHWAQKEIKRAEEFKRERNEYRKLLDECLFSLKNIECQKIDNMSGATTHELARNIVKSFVKFDAGLN